MPEEFEKCIKRMKFYMKLIGLHLDVEDDYRTMWGRVRNHWMYIFHAMSMAMQVMAEILWLFDAFATGKSFLEITSLFPCVTLRLLSYFKTITTLYYAQCVNEEVEILNRLQLDLSASGQERDAFIKNLYDDNLSVLNGILNKTLFLCINGVLLFAVQAAAIMITQYYSTGEFHLMLPFIAFYPFDITYIWRYALLFFHQMWSSFETVMFVYGLDSLFFTCCAFIYIQFEVLKYDMERVVDDNIDDGFKLKFKKLIGRHVELMRCVELLEIVFSKSLLLNTFTSSVIICVTGFNITVNDNIMIMATFASFLTFSLLEIYLYCNYGDNIMRSSMQVGDALYKSQWYNIDAKDRRNFLIVLIRSHKPCKLSAYGFFDINLMAYTSILSTSWSYFALLKTVYHPD